MDSKSDNIKIMFYGRADEVIEELSAWLLHFKTKLELWEAKKYAKIKTFVVIMSCKDAKISEFNQH